MEALDAADLREQVLIWTTALVLAFGGLKLAQGAAPGLFASARAQLSIESRNLSWSADALREGRFDVVTGPSGLSLDGLKRSLDRQNDLILSGAGGRIAVRHEDLLETASRGLR